MHHPQPYTTIESARIMTLAEALEQYATASVSAYMLDGLKGDCYVFDDDARFASLDLDNMFYTNGACGALFRGNLTVDSYIIQPETDSGPFILVLGNVTAKNFFMGGSYIHIEGNTTIEQTLYAGYYNHGAAHINGLIAAEVILSYDHVFNFKSANVKKGVWISGIELAGQPAHDPAHVLNKGYWDKEDQSVNTHNVLKAISKGQSILKPGPTASPVQKRLEKAVLSKNKRADLSKLKLKKLPKELFEVTDLQQLNLSFNPIEITGDELAALEHLHTIELSDCQLEEVPAVLAKMPRLESISLSNNNITVLPDSFSALQQLKKLYLYNCRLTTIPSVLKTLPNLETLNIDYQQDDVLLSIDEMYPSLKQLSIRGDMNVSLPLLEELEISKRATKEVPETLRASKKLKKLDVSAAAALAGLPDWFADFKQLDEICITVHSRFENIKVLSALPKLKTVWISFAGDIVPEAFLELLEVPQWSALYIKGNLDDSSIARQILSRPNLKKLEKYTSFGTETVNIAEERKWLHITV